MELNRLEVAAVELVGKSADLTFIELTNLELASAGGGMGEVCLG